MMFYMICISLGTIALIVGLIALYRIERLNNTVSEIRKILAKVMIESQANHLLVNHIDLYNRLAKSIRELKK